MQIRDIKGKRKEEAIELLADELSDDPVFLYYTQKKGKEHLTLMKRIVSLDLNFYEKKHLIFKGILVKGKLIGVGFMGMSGITVKSALSGIVETLRKLPLSVIGRMIKAGHHTKYHIFPRDSYYLAEIAVRKEHQNKGYGSKLIRTFEDICRKRKKGMGLITDKRNNINFYKKNNFRIIYKNTFLGIRKYYFYKNAKADID